MTKNYALKRTIAGMLALMVVAGTAPAGVSWTKLVGGQSLVASAETESREQFETIDTSAGTDRTDKTYNGTNCSVTGYYYVKNMNGSYGICLGEWDDNSGNYKQRTITISASSGYKITKVEGTISWKNTYLTIGNLQTTAGTLSSDNFNVGGTLTIDNIEGNVSEIVLSDNVDYGIVFDSFKVYYAEAAQNKTDISGATVNLNTDNTVESIKIGENTTINDLKDFVITYGTDDSHTATEPPTTAGTYKAFVKATDDNETYTGEAVSEEFTIVTYTLVAAKDPTVNEAGNSEYYKGSDDNYYKLESDGTTYTKIDENSWVIDKIGVTPVNRVEPTVNETGVEAHFTATINGETVLYVLDEDGKTYVETTADKLAIDKISVTRINKVDPTCVKAGNIEYYTGDDEKLYTYENGTYKPLTDRNEDGAVDIADTVIDIDPDAHEPAEPVKENEILPTYTAEGSYDSVVYCKLCGEELSRENVTVPKLGVPAPMWKWDGFTAATATFEGANGDKPTTLEADITYNITLEPTCTAKGKGTYTAKVKFLGKTYTSSKTITLAAKGHSYGEPEWIWVEGETIRAVFTCENGGEQQTVKATLSHKVTKPTYNKEGRTVYTATAKFGGKTYTDTREIIIDKLPYTAPTVTYKKGDGAVKLTWTEVEGASKYGIAGFIDGEWKFLNSTADTTYILSGLTAGEKYEVAVVSMMGNEWVQDFSNAITVTPMPTPSYPIVSSIEYNEQYHQFRLNWDAVYGAQQYGVAVYIAGRWEVVTQEIPASTTTFTSPKLKAGKTYRMVVCAKLNGKWDTNNLYSRSFNVTVK